MNPEQSQRMEVLYEAVEAALRYIQIEPVLDDDGLAVIAQLRAALALVDGLTEDQNNPIEGE